MLPFALTGCAGLTKKFATVEEFCKVLPEEEYAIKGKTRFDQPWIDDTGEAVIAGCGRERPAPRPAIWDVTPPAPKVASPKTEPPKKRTRFGVPLPKKKPGGASVWDNVPHPFKPAKEKSNERKSTPGA